MKRKKHNYKMELQQALTEDERNLRDAAAAVDAYATALRAIAELREPQEGDRRAACLALIEQMRIQLDRIDITLDNIDVLNDQLDLQVD